MACPMMRRGNVRSTNSAQQGRRPAHTSAVQVQRQQTGWHGTQRKSVKVRTSADWWEDEEEFDGVGGEVLNPKTLHVVVVSQPENTQGSADDAAQTLQAAQTPEITAGFCSPQCESVAQGLWQRIGASKPPYFKKMRVRQALGAASDKDVEDALAELLQQNWRVELDYGLQGRDLVPSEHILLVVNRQEAQALLHALSSQLSALTDSHTPTQLMLVSVRGFNTPEQPQDAGKALGGWKELAPFSVRTHAPAVGTR